VAHQWNEALLEAIRHDQARPTVHARNLFHVTIAMWDAWASYDAKVDAFLHHEFAVALDVEAAREEAISYACYRVLSARFAASPGAPVSLPLFNSLLSDLGYDAGVTETEGASPAALGNRIAAHILAWGLEDGSNEQNGYAANNGYLPVNEPLVVALPGNPDMTHPNRWQPLALEFFVDQGGIVLGAYPPFLGPHWGGVTPFALDPELHWGANTWFDPGLPPLYGGEGDAQFKANNVHVIRLSSTLDPDDGVMMDISPASQGNNPLGTNDGSGHALNPHTGLPYTPQVVHRGDWSRILAEFWADGPHSETPPGHWNTIANYVSTHPEVVKKIEGEGAVVDDLEWDVKLYLALNGAVHDAAVVAWGCKGVYDYVRPISSIRYMASLGQSSDPGGPSYHPGGIPLEPGLIEVITASSAASGQRHAHLAGRIGEIAIRAWRGTPTDPVNDYSGVGWIRAVEWVPYQRPTFVTPPFAGYVSGHSTFSRSAAEVMTRFTGDAFFPGGLGEFFCPVGEYLAFEYGPSEDITLQWATYRDAADESGISRIYGGIHVPADDGPGRFMGEQVGINAYERATLYYGGEAHKHKGDRDGDKRIDLSELLRLIQFFNSGSYHCSAGTEDGYAPGPGAINCEGHDSDYNTQNWVVSLSELLRFIQFFNVNGYCKCTEQIPATEDGWCPTSQG
jgi:hypothetical protein